MRTPGPSNTNSQILNPPTSPTASASSQLSTIALSSSRLPVTHVSAHDPPPFCHSPTIPLPSEPTLSNCLCHSDLYDCPLAGSSLTPLPNWPLNPHPARWHNPILSSTLHVAAPASLARSSCSSANRSLSSPPCPLPHNHLSHSSHRLIHTRTQA